MAHQEIKEVVVELAHGEAHYGYIIDGHEYCYKSLGAAWRMSKRVTTVPSVMELIYNNRRLYLSIGGFYIGGCGCEGQYLYGKRGKLVVVRPE